MTQETKQWIKTAKVWVKTQQLSIQSCDLNIKQAQQQLRLLVKRVRLEKAERREKVKQLNLTLTAIKRESK